MAPVLIMIRQTILAVMVTRFVNPASVIRSNFASVSITPIKVAQNRTRPMIVRMLLFVKRLSSQKIQKVVLAPVNTLTPMFVFELIDSVLAVALRFVIGPAVLIKRNNLP